MSKIEVDEIVAKRIVLKSDKYEITIDAAAGGIWLQNVGEFSPCVCIYMTGGKPVIGIHSKEHVNLACAAALSVDDRGNGFLQIVKDGEIVKAAG